MSKPSLERWNSVARSTIVVGMVHLALASQPVTAQPAWREQGPGPDLVSLAHREESGAVEAIALHPTKPGTVYIAASSGGVWRTSDAFAAQPTWEPLTDGLPSLATSAIAFSKLDPTYQTLYIGTGHTTHGAPLAAFFDGRSSAPRGGILRTTDAGSSWTELGRSIFETQNVQKVVPTSRTTVDGEIILVAASEGIWRSPNGGMTWTRVLPGFASDLVQDPSLVLYAAVSGTVWRSSNGGIDWNAASPARPNCIVLAVSPAPLASGPPVFPVYAGCQPSVFRSTNQGDEWNPLPPFPDGGGFGAWEGVLCVSPESPLAVIAHASKFLGSGDSHYWGYSPEESSWLQLDGSAAANTEPHGDARMCVFGTDPLLMFESDDGGVYRLRNPFAPSRVWEPAIGNLRVTEFLDVAYDNVNDVVFGAAWDISIPQQQSRNSPVWENEQSWGDGMTVGVDNAGTTAFHYSSQQYWFHNHRRQRTGNTVFDEGIVPKIEGIQWNFFEGEIDDSSDASAEGFGLRMPTTWVVNKADGKRLLVGTDYLFESADRGDTYAALGGTTTHPRTGSTIPRLPIGLAYGMAYGHVQNPDVFYVGTTGRARVPRPGIATGVEHRGTAQFWARTSGTGDPEERPTYPGALPLDIAISPGDWRRAYVLDTRGRVWRTPDAGTSWTDVTGDPAGGHALSDLTYDARTIDVADVALDTVLVGGYGGVFVARDAAFSPFPVWINFSTNLPHTTVTDLHHDAVDDVVVIGTWGRGAWKLEQARLALGGVPPSVRLDIGKPSCDDWVVTRSTKFTLTADGDVADVAFAVHATASTPEYTVVPGRFVEFGMPPGVPIGAYLVSVVARTAAGGTVSTQRYVRLVEEADLLAACAAGSRFSALLASLRALMLPRPWPRPLPPPPPPYSRLLLPLINHVEVAAAFVEQAGVLARRASLASAGRSMDGAIRSMLNFDRKIASVPYEALPADDRSILIRMAAPITQSLQTLNVDCRSCGEIPVAYCGDAKCSAPEEACYNCETDCGACEQPCVCDEELRARCEDGSLTGFCCKICSCGDGTCSEEEGCEVCPQDCGACAPPLPSCGETYPSCDGTCPLGQACESDTIDSPPSCRCVSTMPECGDSSPQCNGTCPPGEGCFNQESSCVCAVPIP